ncbi:MAG TPA: DeoR family transcriptional regulator [Candidatus Pacearchaeota archaeon]|nr:DeoR family transcriptional regulator [Candidatus Pacearchaeota archaeon]
MEKRQIIDLTNKVYRLTLLFPKKEPLRYKIREIANDILTFSINWESLNSLNPGKYASNLKERKKETIFNLEESLDVIHNYFEISKWQNWINYFEILEIQEEYDKIKKELYEEIKKIEIEEKTNEIQNIPKNNLIEEKDIQTDNNFIEKETRKEKIIKILKKVEKIQVGEINKLFPDVSKRTIRRDFQKMLDQGIIERIGEKNNTYYRLKNR